jgi:hypothetical protein
MLINRQILGIVLLFIFRKLFSTSHVVNIMRNVLNFKFVKIFENESACNLATYIFIHSGFTKYAHDIYKYVQ